MKKLIWLGAFLLVLALTLRLFFFSTQLVAADSMEPTLHHGDRLFLSKMAYKWSEPDRFDILVLPYNETMIIKRVIGLPGEHLAYKNGKLYVDGKQLAEPFKPSATEDFTMEALTDEKKIPAGHVFVLGDNRSNSLDSRDPSVGFIPISEITGKILYHVASSRK